MCLQVFNFIPEVVCPTVEYVSSTYHVFSAHPLLPLHPKVPHPWALDTYMYMYSTVVILYNSYWPVPTDIYTMQPMATQRFFLKEARQRVYSCIKHFAQLNSLGSGEGGQDGGSGSTVSSTTPSISPLPTPPPPPPPQWAEFVRSTSSSSCHDTAVLDASGRCVKGVISFLVGCVV